MHEAVILVGGKGTRLQAVVADRPKPMATIRGKPFIEWILIGLSLQGIRRVVLAAGHMADYLEDGLGNGDRFGLEIVYARDPFPLGTGGAIRNALKYLDTNCFLALNGDSYCTFNLQSLLAMHQLRHAMATLLLTEVADCGRYGTVEVDSNGAVFAFHEKFENYLAGIINAGIYILERSAVEVIQPDIAVSIEREFFPALVGRGLFGLVEKSLFIDIGTPESYRAAEEFLDNEFRKLELAVKHGFEN